MPHDNFPRGAGLGRDTDRRRPGLIDYEWTMEHGSRAQRREIMRQLKMYKRQGNTEAGAVLDDFRRRFIEQGANGASMAWRVSVPGRAPFTVICPQHATADEIRAQWPGADVEAIHD